MSVATQAQGLPLMLQSFSDETPEAICPSPGLAGKLTQEGEIFAL
jgi:hypothetical protein